MVLRLIIAAAALAGIASPGIARPDPTSPQPASPATGARETLEQTAARVVTRLALTDLRVVGTPGETDYRIAASLIEAAHAMAPRDEQILRQLIEAQENANNPDRVLELTRELLKLDPADTVAQLRLISSSIRNLQNADDRLAAIDRWLGQEGKSIDPSVLSRLAFDAALLAREKGDPSGFAKRLGKALELDATNKDAATMALAYYTQRVGEPAGQFELMLAVLNADPLDSDLHLAMARHLASGGSYRGASRFFITYGMLLGARGAQFDPDVISEYDLIRWRLDGARSVIERYDRDLFEHRQGVRRQREDAAKDKRPLDAIPTPEQIRLPMGSEWVRFLAAAALGDPQLLDSALDELIATAGQEADQYLSAEKRPQDMSEEDAYARVRGLREEVTWARLVADKQLDKVAEELDKFRADPTVDKARLNNLEAYSLVRKGDFDGAERLLKPHIDEDPIAALAWCTLLERRAAGSSNPEAGKAATAEALEALARREAATLPGAYAATRYEVLTGKPVALNALAKRLDDLAAGVPSWLETMIENPRRIQSLEAELVTPDVRALDPVYIKLTLRNVSPTVLGVGPDRAINTRLLLAPQLNIGIASVKTGDKINVVSMEKRLRLSPREEFSCVVLADSPTLSLLLEQVSNRLSRVRYRVLQGFEALESGAYDAGPHCLSVECGPVRREVLPKSALDVPTLVRHAEAGSARDVAEAILVVLGRTLPYQDLTPLTPEESETFFKAVAKHLPELPAPGQLLALSILPTQGQMKEMKYIDDAARPLTDPTVRAVFLATRVQSVDDAVFSDAASRSSPALASTSDLVQARLRAGTPCYATYNSPSPAAPAAPAPPGGASAVQPDK